MENSKNKIKEALPFTVGAITFLIIVIAFFGITVISDGYVGVKQTLGNYNDRELGTGVHIVIPLISTVKKVDTRKITITEKVEVPSKEGLIISLDLSVI